MQEAIEHWQLAAEMRPHEVLFHNIGTASFCMDKLDTAEQTYLNNQSVNKESYLSEEALGKVNYYRGNFSIAADLQRRALDKLGDDANIHQMWASLADSYRQAGNEKEALQAYKKALEVIEKDLLLGIAEHASALHRQYYLLRMNAIDERSASDTTLNTWEIDHKIAEGQNLSASEQIRLAQLYALNGKLHEANVVWEKAAHTCPVYLKNPELVQLLGERHMQHAGAP